MSPNETGLSTSVKQSVVICTANNAVVGATPANKRRIFLQIQNTGVNPVLFRFENAVQRDGGDLVLTGGATLTYTNPCPVERLNYLSLLGTTVAVIEGVGLP